MKKIISIIGARPQFIKHAPMQIALQRHYNALTVHTGQHYDENMSNVFFNELNIPKPNYLFNLPAGAGHGEQTALMMIEIEKVCLAEKPTAILLYGDTNSTLAGALVAAKMGIPQIHIEAGLRSFNRSMPEEVNRIVSDEFAYLLFSPTITAIENLKKEGINHERIFLSGDVMCDVLRMVLPKVKKPDGVNYPFYFVTLHRPYNTDSEARLIKILSVLNSLDQKVIFSIHPRTIGRMASYGINAGDYPNIHFVPPVSYTDSISYQMFSDLVITDSGGMQKEAYMLKKQCITLRSETEWVETTIEGWNTLVFDEVESLPAVMLQKPGAYQENLYGDGNAADEIVNLIQKYI